MRWKGWSKERNLKRCWLSLWLFLFLIFLLAVQPKEFFLDGLKELEQQSHKCVELRGGICKYIFSIPQLVAFFIKPKTYEPPS
jgi:hypothetical protein